MPRQGDGCHFPDRCDCYDHGPRIEGFVVPCLLLLLRQQAAHGYEIMEKLDSLPFLAVSPDPGVVYRHLRRLEDEGKVRSRVEPGSGGPARRVYTITAEGEEHLAMWAVRLRRRKEALEAFLETYAQCCPS